MADIWTELALVRERISTAQSAQEASGLRSKLAELLTKTKAMELDPLVRNYRQAAQQAVFAAPGNPQFKSPGDIAAYAADGAVHADRARMALQLRNRVLTGEGTGLPPEIAMKVDELLLDLAAQIEAGMPRT